MISIHAPREGGDGGMHQSSNGGVISIHAPREGGDGEPLEVWYALAGISIHAPREGGDLAAPKCRVVQPEFQSTPPARGATRIRYRAGLCDHRISIHAPREGGDAYVPRVIGQEISISIHAPREGGDKGRVYVTLNKNISIHAPREGGDLHSNAFDGSVQDFNPRPPRGGRR